MILLILMLWFYCFIIFLKPLAFFIFFKYKSLHIRIDIETFDRLAESWNDLNDEEKAIYHHRSEELQRTQGPGKLKLSGKI